MITTKISDTMTREMLNALTRRTKNGRYRIAAPVRTLTALETRGMAERVESDHNADKVPHHYLTAEGMSHLRSLLRIQLAERGENRAKIVQEWLNADLRHEWAVIDFLGFTADRYEVTTTTPQEGGEHRETLGRADAWRRMGSAITNGQRITLDGRAMTVHTKLGARWTFAPVEEAPAVEVEDIEHRMFVGILRDDAKDTGTVQPDNVRAAIKNANGHPVERLDDGVIRVGYSWFVPCFPVAHVTTEGQMVTTQGGVDTPVTEEAPARVDLATLPTAEDVVDAPHAVYVDGRKRHDGIPAERVRTIVGNLRFKRQAFTQEADGTICVETRRYVPVRAEEPQPRPAAEVLAADPIPADTSVLEGMPGEQIARKGLRTPDGAQALRHDAYVVQLRSERVWQLPNHDDGAHTTRGNVTWGVCRMMDEHPDHTRASVVADGTVYVSNGWQAYRYIPVTLLSDYTPGHCPGCGTPYATNGDGPCAGGRSPLAPGSRDFDAEAAELLGAGERWVRHWYSDGKHSAENSMGRAEALDTVSRGLRRGTVRRADEGGVRVEHDGGTSAYWLEPAADREGQPA